MRVSLLDATGTVVNVVLDGDRWVPPDSLTIGPQGGEIGDRWDGIQYVRIAPKSRPLDEVKSELIASVYEIAEEIRARYATSQAGLAMTYQEKFAQANAVDAMGEAAANGLTPEQMVASFPILSASVGIEAPTLWSAAQLVIGKYQEWSQLAGMIERARLAGKRAIAESASVEAAETAFEAIKWLQ